jgi:hypothetical protein
MKLSPPASSSDLDAAREIARRLNHIAMPAEPARPLPPYAPLKAGRDGGLVPPRRPSPPAWERAVTPAPASGPAATPAPPPAIAAPPLPSEPAAIVEPAPFPEPHPREVAPPPVVETMREVPPAEVEAPAPPPPRMSVAPPPLPAPRPVAVAPPPVPVEEVEDVQEIEEDLGPDDSGASIEAAVAAPLSWSEIVAACLSLAEAKGALLIDPEGHVVAVSGDWPSPGAESIAARLVPAMDKALKDAPTRSVSVPLGGLHLTAWRAPMSQGLVTVGFVADAPLRPDLRPAIDATLRKGPEA